MMMNGFHALWWLWPILIFGAIGIAVWPPTRSLWNGSGEAEKIARRRYAAGEIDEIELHDRLAELRRQ